MIFSANTLGKKLGSLVQEMVEVLVKTTTGKNWRIETDRAAQWGQEKP